ncbi:hypothetical protein L7F22_034138 [Adiantum nelumboides]|nr:hypothetical protein [Adiantum nelumboides]
MPPKPTPNKAAKEKQKADVAKKVKQVEDKTFGLKNKNKSKNVQKYVNSLQQSVTSKAKRADEDPKLAAKKKKEEESQREKELNELFKVAISQPKVPVGVDPKSIVCEFFRRGQCAKGFKCKYSHDLNVERKGEKIDLYSDQRDATMEDWDQETLEKVVESKNNEYSQNKPTDIVCKFFLDAVEKKQYGWFWVCPRELFASDASLFVDDAEAYDNYERDKEQQDEAAGQTSTGSRDDGGGPSTSRAISDEDEIFDDDDDELDPEELDELEASISKASLENT